jgi:ABC-type multidrug transport system fused ATPase/permease subunit
MSTTMLKIAHHPLLFRAGIMLDMLTALGVTFLGIILFLTLRKENEKIALFMNNNFVNIKVDREERPDLDAVFVNSDLMAIGAINVIQRGAASMDRLNRIFEEVPEISDSSEAVESGPLKGKIEIRARLFGLPISDTMRGWTW